MEAEFEWTPEARRLSAMAEITIGQVVTGEISGIEALELTLYPPDHPGLDEMCEQIAEKQERIATGLQRKPETQTQAERRRDRRRARYASDPDYRAKELERQAAKRSKR